MPVALDLTDPALAAAVHALGRRAYAAEAQLIGSDAIPPLHESLAEMCARELRWLGTFSADGALAGFLAWQRLPDGDLDLDRLCVDPPCFRQGHATRLLTAVLRDGPAAQVGTAEANLPAIRLYERFGFQRVGMSEPPGGPRLVHFRRAGLSRVMALDPR
ncbi:MAG: GNAT family N-acetyltransferase [Verrucomicrobia bacterium]|nr:GNAT family N-acetyltransferase [Verrucomicrobiota bacterium]